MARKGKRRITVGERTFRYAATGSRDLLSLIIEPEGTGGRLVARFDPFVLHGQGFGFDGYTSKRYVRIAIVEAIRRGWIPENPGEYLLGEADLFGEHPEADWATRAGMPRQLLDAVIDALEQDAPRLVLADYLMQMGDPRGTFIRAQCAGEYDRERLWRYFRRWSAPAWRVAKRWTFARGFIDTLEVERPPDRGAWEALHRLEPVQKVTLRPFGSRGDLLSWIVQPSHRDLTAHLPELEAAELLALLRSPSFGRLSTLSLQGLDDAAAVQLAHGPPLSRLEVLELRGNPIGEACALAILRSPSLANVPVIRIDPKLLTNKTRELLRRRGNNWQPA